MTPSGITNYRDLEVWQKAMALVEKIYQISLKIPSEEKFGLISQMQRAAVSIPANIAEGFGRNSTKEYLYHLSVSRGSLMELETYQILLQRLNYLDKPSGIQIWKLTQDTSRLLSGLMRALRKKTPARSSKTGNNAGLEDRD